MPAPIMALTIHEDYLPGSIGGIVKLHARYVTWRTLAAGMNAFVSCKVRKSQAQTDLCRSPAKG